MGAPPHVSLPGVVVAHRAANLPADVGPAVAAGADVLEADVHLFRHRLEVRHGKTLGPFPRLWEKWYLLDRGAPRPPLGTILAAVPPGTGLLLDLKGPDPRLAGAVLRALAAAPPPGDVRVCGRWWGTVDRLRGAPGVRTMHSAGSRAQLRLLLRRRPGSLEGASVRRDLLAPGVVAALRDRADEVWTWPVPDRAAAEGLAAWGVTGFITDDPARLRG
jgi:glycerophosphoryl diester phosphodiesterase